MPFSSADLAEAGVSLALSDVGDLQAIGSSAKEEKTHYQRNVFHVASFAYIGTTGVLAIFAMILEASTLVYCSMTLTVLITTAAAYQRFWISRQDSFRQIHNHVREEVNRLQQENSKLTVEITSLSRQAQRVQETERELQGILGKQNTQVEGFLSLLRENSQLQSSIHELLVTQVLQQFLSILLQADVDRDFVIDENEVDVLLLRVKALPGVQHVEEARVRQLLLGRGHGLESVYNLVHELSEEEKSWVTLTTRNL